jgi:hypothetical protein
MSDVAEEHLNEVWVALCCPDADAVRDDPEKDANEDQLHAKPDGGGDCGVQNSCPARCAAKEDRLGQSTV